MQLTTVYPAHHIVAHAIVLVLNHDGPVLCRVEALGGFVLVLQLLLLLHLTQLLLLKHVKLVGLELYLGHQVVLRVVQIECFLWYWLEIAAALLFL